MTKKYTFKDLFDFVSEKYKENPGDLDIPIYVEKRGTKMVMFGRTTNSEYINDPKYTFVVTNKNKELRLYKQVKISEYCTQSSDFKFINFEEMYSAITNGYKDLIDELPKKNTNEVFNKEVSLEAIISALKLEGSFKTLYGSIFDALVSGYVAQIAIEKKYENRTKTIEKEMKIVMEWFENCYGRSFVNEFGFNMVERADEILELMFNKIEQTIRGKEFEIYILKPVNF